MLRNLTIHANVELVKSVPPPPNFVLDVEACTAVLSLLGLGIWLGVAATVSKAKRAQPAKLRPWGS